MLRAVNAKMQEAVGKCLQGVDNWRMWATGPSCRELETYLLHMGATRGEAHKGAQAITADRDLHRAMQAWGELSRALTTPNMSWGVPGSLSLTYGGVCYLWMPEQALWVEKTGGAAV